MTHLNLSLTDEFASVAAELRRSTVQVKSGGDSVGSGVIWHSNGLIISNAHVARGSKATIELWDGRVLDGTITAKDPVRDLAAISINATNLPAATIGNSNHLRVGELVLAMGNPLGVVGALTTGIIHAVGESGREEIKQTSLLCNPKSKIKNPKLFDWLQADIRLFPGNSGGPLADACGRVIGINSMVANGLALAIPSLAVEHFLSNREARPYLGIMTQPVLVRFGYQRILGLLVLAVTANSPAESAGIYPFDILIQVGGQFFKTPNDLLGILGQMNPGDVLPLELIRNGQSYQMNVMVGGGKTQVEAV